MGTKTVTEDEILDEIRGNILEENRAYLCKKLDPRNYYPYLRSVYLLSEEDEEEIRLETSRVQKAHKMLDILIRKGPSAYKGLVDAILHNKTQTFLVEKLNKEYERKKNNLQALLNGRTLQPPVDNLGVDIPSLPPPPVTQSTVQNMQRILLNQRDSYGTATEVSSESQRILLYQRDSSATEVSSESQLSSMTTGKLYIKPESNV